MTNVMTDGKNCLHGNKQCTASGQSDFVPRESLHAKPPIVASHDIQAWKLTPRQWRVLFLIGEAQTNKAIAYELGICESTVKAHISTILKTTGSRNRVALALLAQRIHLGVLAVGEDPQNIPIEPGCLDRRRPLGP